MKRPEIKRIITERVVAAVAMLTMLVGCTEEEQVTGEVTLTTGTTTELYAVTNQSTEVKFEAKESWKASCGAAWLTFSPKSGEAGQQTITVSTTATNRTKATRTAQLTIESGGAKKTVTLRQRDDYAIFDREEWTVPATGGSTRLTFVTNLEKDQIQAYASQGLEEWVSTASAVRTRTEYGMAFNEMTVAPNTSSDARSGALMLTMKDKSGNLMGLDTLWIYQEGADPVYRSTDYSQDGKVRQLNRATEGKGIPVVLMGDGFTDADIASGRYDSVMAQTVENLMSEEPVRSLRSYFNIWQVTAVSAKAKLEGGGSTVFSTVPDHQTTGIEVDESAVMKYVKKVEGIDSLHTLAVVILNTAQRKGVTYMFRSTKHTDYSYAIALCPVIDSLKSEEFRRVLTHEAIGHGFGKLADEYVRSTEGSATDSDLKELAEMHSKYGWYLNVDGEQDSTKVLWSKMIYDEAFSEEKIGIYEGGYTYYKGVYRPTEESMMRSNDAPFNAAGRQAIYNKVMKLGLDKTATYEEFRAFDAVHKPTAWHYDARSRQTGHALWQIPWQPARPRVRWRD